MKENKLYAFLNSTINKMMQAFPSALCSCGYANGYVAVPPDHPVYCKDYHDVAVDVHCELTFGDSAKVVKQWKDIECIGFNSIDEVPDDYWVFGFDTLHYKDNLQICNKEWCIEETLRLKKQLVEMEDSV